MPTQAARPSSFGVISSFGSSPSPWISGSGPDSAVAPPRDSSEDTATCDNTAISVCDVAEPSDTMSRALHRAKMQRSAIFGHADIAADGLITSYLQSSPAAGNKNDKTALEDLSQELDAVHKKYPEAARFMRLVFDRACHPQDKKPKEASKEPERFKGSPRERHSKVSAAPEQVPKNPMPEQSISTTSKASTPLDENEAPTEFFDIEWPSALYDSIKREVFRKLIQLKWWYGRAFGPASHIAMAIVAGQSKDVLKVELKEKFRESGFDEMDGGVEIFGDWLYEKVWELQKNFETSSKMDEKDEAGQTELGKTAQPQSVSRIDPADDWYGTSKARLDNRPCCEKGIVESTSSTRTSDTLSTPFQFLDLPAELRTWVYREALVAPGPVSLRSCLHHLPLGTNPVLNTALLSTCSQIRKEAKDLMLENTYIVNVFFDGVRSVIHRQQLPDHIRPRIRNLAFVLDGTRGNGGASDWQPLQSLTSLKRLTITAIDCPTLHSLFMWANLIKEIVERIPADCEIQFEAESMEVEEHIAEMKLRVGAAQFMTSPWGTMRDVVEVDAQVLKGATERALAETTQGCTSGETKNYRSLVKFEQRDGQ